MLRIVHSTRFLSLTPPRILPRAILPTSRLNTRDFSTTGASEAVLALKDDKEKSVHPEQIPFLSEEDEIVPENLKSTPDFIKELGWYPFCGLLFTALLSKEFVQYGPDILYGAFSSSIMFLGYLYMADPIKKSAEAQMKFNRENEVAFFNSFVSLNKLKRDYQVADINAVGFLQDAQEHLKKSGPVVLEYHRQKELEQLTKNTVAELEGLWGREQAEQKKIAKQAVESIRSSARDLAEKDSVLKVQAMEYAFANMFAERPLPPDHLYKAVMKQYGVGASAKKPAGGGGGGGSPPAGDAQTHTTTAPPKVAQQPAAKPTQAPPKKAEQQPPKSSYKKRRS